MLEPPESANRLPAAPGNRPRAGSRPGQAEATAAQAGATAAAGVQAALSSAQQQALGGSSGVAERDRAAGSVERDGAPRTAERDGAAQAIERAGATRVVEHDGAHQAGREGPAQVVERQGMARAAESPSTTSWPHDWLQLSHELRTPLNAILGNIELLLDGSAGPLAASARACIGDIQLASRQLLTQLQPLLLLVQARTSGALATRMPLDLLALIRQASADAASQPEPRLSERSHADHGAACASGSKRLMVSGDPIWLGVLAAALVDLHGAAPAARGPLSITWEPTESGAGGAVLRASWEGFDPATASPLSLALIDAVVALHGGRILTFCADGLRVDLPVDVVGSEGSIQGSC